ncbi:DUF4189 domain-containing protein [Paralysiella testudinis]|uniref:DUF4189 domain-containing protein n=1 Tax=Paralysiella testudinis TaxID=2809020 RepID=A0A892ZER2_9NEIS|nr:DUF4189 domain-containing protein [Paralysiella testudinis]QRQ81551.1 DUF4189 domain-containing protein [Paralysiella testudinis]
MTTSASYTQKQDAQRSAEELCRAGGQGACTVLQTFADTCGAVAYAKYQGKPQYFTATDADPKQAEQKHSGSALPNLVTTTATTSMHNALACNTASARHIMPRPPRKALPTKSVGCSRNWNDGQK